MGTSTEKEVTEAIHRKMEESYSLMYIGFCNRDGRAIQGFAICQWIESHLSWLQTA
jgi:hypothetical protein